MLVVDLRLTTPSPHEGEYWLPNLRAWGRNQCLCAQSSTCISPETAANKNHCALPFHDNSCSGRLVSVRVSDHFPMGLAKTTKRGRRIEGVKREQQHYID